MKVTEFKEITQVLGLFASARESAEQPTNLIGVQVSNGQAKLIAGQGVSAHGQGVIVTLDGYYDGKFSYVIDARPLLQSAKVITGKQEVEISVTDAGVTITTSEGGKIFLKVEGYLRDAGFPKKPKEFLVTSQIAGTQFSQLAKLFDVIHGDFDIEAPSLENNGNTTHMVAVQVASRAMYAHLSVPSIGQDGYYAAGYAAFWRSLKYFDTDGTIQWGEDGLVAVSGNYELYSTSYKVSPYDKVTRKSEPPRNPSPWPQMVASGNPSVSLTVDKKKFIEAIKGVMPYDEHARIVVTVDNGSVNVAAFGVEGGMTVPAETTNKGNRACNSEYLLKLLGKMDGKSVTIGWAQQPAMILSAPEMVGWNIFLAPVALSGGN